MPILLETQIALGLLNGHQPLLDRLDGTFTTPTMSLLTLIELERSVRVDPDRVATRTDALNAMLMIIRVLPVGPREVALYAAALDTGDSPKLQTHDRLIAATAISNEMRLATIDPGKFGDDSLLQLEDWSTS